MVDTSLNQQDPVIQQQLDKINQAGNRKKSEEL